jgi:CheY-like chemotaxis protein
MSSNETNLPDVPLAAPGGATGVLLGVRDLFFRVKLEPALRRLHMPFRVLPASPPQRVPQGSTAGDAPRAIREAVAQQTPELLILDLSDPSLEPLESVRELRANPALADMHIIGFASHVDRDLRRTAAEAGCDVVVTRARIANELPDLLARLLQGSDRSGQAPLRRDDR